MEDSARSVKVDWKNGPTSSIVVVNEHDDDGRKIDEIVREIPYDETSAIIIFEEQLLDRKLSSNVVGFWVHQSNLLFY